MFIFNHELILHEIDSWPRGILIFVMACIGNFTFAAATQGWFAVRNRWYEVPFLLLTTVVMMRPAFASEIVGIPYEYRYFMYLLGLAVAGGVFFWQRYRTASERVATVYP